MEQAIHQLLDSDLADLEAKRDWVRNHYEPNARHKYDTVQGKLNLLDAILSNCWVSPDETLKLQCLGIALGDALAQHMTLVWVVVEDDYGRDPALSLAGTTVLVFPQTMISKRVEDGEEIDVFKLFNGICEVVRNSAADSA